MFAFKGGFLLVPLKSLKNFINMTLLFQHLLQLEFKLSPEGTGVCSVAPLQCIMNNSSGACESSAIMLKTATTDILIKKFQILQIYFDIVNYITSL